MDMLAKGLKGEMGGVVRQLMYSSMMEMIWLIDDGVFAMINTCLPFARLDDPIRFASDPQ